MLLNTIGMSLGSLNRLGDDGNLTELGIADHAVAIVVAASKDGFNVLSAREETILLKEGDQVRHSNGMVSFRNGIEHSHLDEILARSQLSLCL